jgi:DNA-binding transcriptional MerR regulator
VSDMNIGELSRRSGLAVRTLRFYADAGVLPEAARSASGYRVFGPEVVAQARLLRTLRELGVGVEDIRRVLAAEVSLPQLADRHARALDAQIRTLRLQRAVLRAVATSTDAEELARMNDLTKLTADERGRILEDYLDAVYGGHESAAAARIRGGAPELPDDPTADQVAAWVELVELLRDPGYIASSRRIAQRVEIHGAAPDGGHDAVALVAEQGGAAVRAGVEPGSPEALAVIERVEAIAGCDRLNLAERLEAVADGRLFRYWTLVGIVNGWPDPPVTEDSVNAWQWYAKALRAHAAADEQAGS